MKHLLRKWPRRILLVLATALAVVLALRAYQSTLQPDLGPWHSWVPDEPRALSIDKLDWQGWMHAEDALFVSVEAHMREALAPDQRIAANRYFDGSPINPAHFAHNWNRSFVLPADGELKGAVVLLHGLTDSPYSLRHVAKLYAAHGFVAIGIRLPAHGTVPAALSAARWEDWRAATRLAMREASRIAGPQKPLQLVGYSNGGALAMQYAIDATQDPSLVAPQRVVLFSPMIGLTGYARYAGVAGWPAAMPAFAKSAWLDVLPEINPFKYSSFPVNAARQSYQLTQALGEGIAAATRSGAIAKLPPILAFQSAVDTTVNSAAVISGLFAQLPANGSEIVLFDVNRAGALESLLSRSALGIVGQMIPTGKHLYRATVLGTDPGSAQIVETSIDAGTERATRRPLGLTYPADFISLSHIALPFPCSDSLYGTEPDDEKFGIHLGNQARRGERGVLLMGAEALMRASCNPFFPYVIERIEEGLPAISR